MPAALDYATFLHGLLLLLLAAALATRERPAPHIPWSWLAWFALLQGVATWLGLAAFELLGWASLDVMRLVLAIGSFLTLGEFGRQGLRDLGLRTPGPWLHVPVLGLAGCGLFFGAAGVDLTSRLVMGIPGALVGSICVARARFGAGREQRFPLGSLAIGLLGAAAAMALSAPGVARLAWSAGLVRGVPGAVLFTQLLGAVAAGLMLLGAWRAAYGPDLAQGRSGRLRRLLVPIGVALPLALGAAAVGWLDGSAGAGMRQQLVAEAIGVARAINPSQVKLLRFAAEDRQNPSFQWLRRQLVAYAGEPAKHWPTGLPVTGTYTMAMRNGRLVFGPESISESSPFASPPGTVYRQPPSEVLRVFRTHQPTVAGPYTDEYGRFLSGLAPVLDPRSGEVILVVGIDLPTAAFERTTASLRLVPMALTTVVLFLLAVGEALVRRRDRHGEVRTGWLAHLEVVLTSIGGLVLTVTAVAAVLFLVRGERGAAFRSLAENQAERVASALTSVRDHQLASLTAFVANSREISQDEFHAFAAPLAQSASVRGLAWAPRVAPPGQVDQANRRPAPSPPGIATHPLKGADLDPTSHDAFPVLDVAPANENQLVRGADLASEERRRAAIEEAIRTGFPTASAPLILSEESTPELGMLAVTAIRKVGDPAEVLGVAAAAVRFQPLLMHALAYPDPGESPTRVRLLSLESGQRPQCVAAFPPIARPGEELASGTVDASAVVRPVFVFGQAFAVEVVRGGSSGLVWPAVLVGALGLLLTFAVAGLTTSLAGRRAQLDREVRERTAELLEREGTLRAIVDSALNAIVMIGPDGTVSAWNPAAERLLGYSAGEVIGRDVHQLIAPPGVHREAALGLERFRATGDGPAIGRVLELPALSRDGGEVPVELALAPVRIGGAWHAVGVMSDLSERRRIEAERRAIELHVVEAQKLESLGVLAGGIAHDFNNILMGITARTDAALLKLPSSSPLRPGLEDLKQQVRRAADLVRQMLAFSGKGRILVGPLDPAELVKGLLALVRPSLPRGAELRLEIPQGLPHIRGDAAQVRQLLTNLLLNAGEALTGGRGVITVSAGHDRFTADELAVPHLALEPGAGAFVWLEVADDGSGMDTSTLQRVYEPFFSTRALGRGLGLSAVLGIVRGHNGSIQVSSQLGAGTRVRVFLPAAPPI